LDPDEVGDEHDPERREGHADEEDKEAYGEE
jgi:hypothetical protein